VAEGLTGVQPYSHSGGENLTMGVGGGKRDKEVGNLSKGGNRWLIGGMRPASEGNGTRRRCLVLGGSGHR
jgi:hypothetical protein